VAAEAGGQTLAAARRVGPAGRVLAAADCLRFAQESFGALHQMLSGLPPAEQDQAWAEVDDALRQFEGPDGFVGPCRLLVAAGTR